MATKRKTKQEWLAIFEAQSASGLSVPAFCEAKDIKIHSFHARKSDLKKRGDVSRARNSKSTTLVKVAAPVKTSSIMTLSYQSVSLTIPTSSSPQYIADIIKALDA